MNPSPTSVNNEKHPKLLFRGNNKTKSCLQEKETDGYRN